MNEPNEGTHYQVELTSRQVLVALVVLLICLFAAFFAGVWIGRDAGPDTAAPAVASVETETRPDERFDFFSRTAVEPGDEGDAAGSRGTDPPTRPLDDSELVPSSPLDDSAFGPDPDDAELDAAGLTGADPEALFEDDPESELPPPEEMGRGGRRRRAVDAAEDDVSTADRDLAVSETDPEEPAAAPPEAGSTPASTAASASGFQIQVLATSDRRKAEVLVDRLVDADFNAFLVPSDEGGRMIYRVRVGPFSDRGLATRQAAELESRWGLDSWISPGTP